MSEFKGTPGPWWSEDEDFSSCGEDAVITCNARYGMVEICRIDQGGTIADEDNPFVVEQQANANLISAAPELLEACLSMRNQLYAAGYEAVKGSLNPTKCLLAQVEEAVAKAMGGK